LIIIAERKDELTHADHITYDDSSFGEMCVLLSTYSIFSENWGLYHGISCTLPDKNVSSGIHPKRLDKGGAGLGERFVAIKRQLISTLLVHDALYFIV
jgi:hypothetical protein